MNNTKGTVLKVFSIYKNINWIIKKNKNIDIDDIINPIIFERNPKIIKFQCKKIYNEIENSHYDYQDLKLALLYFYIYKKSVNFIADLNFKNINTIKCLFTKNQLEMDKKFLLNLNNKTKGGLKDCFKILENGGCLIYELTMKNYISPYFFVKFGNTDKEENENVEYSRFKRIIKLIKSII